jgi:hypothetical protein
MIGRQRRRASLPFRLAHHDPFPGSVIIPAHVVEEFCIRVRRRGPNECWPCDPAKPGGNVEPDPGNSPRLGWRDPETNAYQTIPAHRLAIIIDSGPFAPELLALHLCSHSKCCNPAHIYGGTNEQFSQDRTLRNAILRAQGPGSLEGVILPRHPRSAAVCEAMIAGDKTPAATPTPRVRIRPARQQGAQS